MLTLEVTQRDTTKKPQGLREDGVLPAVFYGRKEEATPIAIDAITFGKIWRNAGESTVITLTGVGEEKEVLIQDVQVHPVTGEPLHADFYAIEKGKKLHVHVPIEFIGSSPAVKELGGTLVKVLHEIEVEVLPKDLPHEIQVDISVIEDFDTHIHIKDVALPAGVVALTDSEEVVAIVAPAKEEVEEEIEEAPDFSSIEVEKKGKEEEETRSESSDSKEA